MIPLFIKKKKKANNLSRTDSTISTEQYSFLNLILNFWFRFDFVSIFDLFWRSLQL